MEGIYIYCWYCSRPIIIPSKVKVISRDTIAINVNVRMSEQKVKCSSCGAGYILQVYSDSKPTVSKEVLDKLDNRVRT